MSTFPGAPRLLKAAIIGIDVFNPLASAVIFHQYNPDTLTRNLQIQSSGEGGDRSEAQRLTGPPVETIKLDAEIDIREQLEITEETLPNTGIYPQLAALEMLVYPKSSLVIANTALMATGTIEVIPPQGPLTLFIWGLKRVLPVKLTEFSITEEAYDVNLNPICAKVSLTLRVLTYNDLSLTNPGYHLFLTHQIVKETMATVGSLNTLSKIGIGKANLF